MNNLVGTDAEFFLFKDGEVVASQNVIPGVKGEPYHLPGGGTVHRDNVMGELGMVPAEDEDSFVEHIQSAVSDIESIIKPQGLELGWLPSIQMPAEQLLHWEAGVFGCDEDYDCWKLDFTPPPDVDVAGNLRSSGGHVHIGFDVKNNNQRYQVAKACDISLGLGSVIYDKDTLRRKLYGKSGRFRPKAYGIEYRTLSNVWLRDEDMMRWVFRGAIKALELADQVELLSEAEVLSIKNIIDTGDSNKAVEYIKKYNMEIPPC